MSGRSYGPSASSSSAGGERGGGGRGASGPPPPYRGGAAGPDRDWYNRQHQYDGRGGGDRFRRGGGDRDPHHRDHQAGGGRGDMYRREERGGDRRDPYHRGQPGEFDQQQQQHRGGGDLYRRGGGEPRGGPQHRWHHPSPQGATSSSSSSSARPPPHERDTGAMSGYSQSNSQQSALSSWGPPPFAGPHLPPPRDEDNEDNPTRSRGSDDYGHDHREQYRSSHSRQGQREEHDNDLNSHRDPPQYPPRSSEATKDPVGTSDEEGQVVEQGHQKQQRSSNHTGELQRLEDRADFSKGAATSTAAPDSKQEANQKAPSTSRPDASGYNDGGDDPLAREGAEGDPPSSHKSKFPTPNPTSCLDGDAPSSSEHPHRRSSGRSPGSGGSITSSRKLLSQSIYGRPLEVSSHGSFPSPGATLGPWFCLGQMGKGTFSSIHKVVGLAAATATPSSTETALTPGASARRGFESRLAAAKVELTSFQQSGVLEAEAAILDFLHRSLQPSGSAEHGGEGMSVVPNFFGYYRCTTTASSTITLGPAASSSSPTTVASALIMEYLPGQDMHQLREAVMTHPEHYANSSTGKDHHHHPHSSTRRIELADAVYLTAEVMLPLLRRLHSVGVVHRDVKPSNCVLRREKSKSEGGGGEFRMVDFGLSKSIVVPEDSPHADKEHYWPESRPWQKPSNYTRRGCYRVAREKAEFRGTSMYASLRVHQLRDYCPRDDMWSLMYVFCDLVSGGLPWMQQAANRDRTECQRIKEMVHGDGEKYETDQTELLLMGDCYHVAKFRKDRYEAAAQAAESSGRQPPAPPSKSIDLPPPLALSQDPRLVSRLRDVFTHLAKLEFWETPDYDMIQRNIRGFLDTTVRTPLLPRISYDMPVADRGMHKSSLLDSRRNMPRGSLPEETDPLAGDIFENVDDSSESAKNSDDCLRLLPLELRYRLAQMEYHASRPDAVPMTLALRDWLKATLPLLYGEWDTPKYEGRHRTSTDGLKRELYLELLERCLRWASAFDNFTSKSCYTKDTTKKRLLESSRRSNSGDDPAASTRISKQRRIDPLAAAFITVSRALFGLRLAIQVEQAKKSGAQATRLNFS